MSTHRPGSVWACGQQAAPRQRGHRYAVSSTTHPAKMFPAIAAHAITAYSKPGDLVLDPMCGIGTTLVEAIAQDRRAIGVDYEPHWAAITAGNLHLARGRHPGADATVHLGDAQHLTRVLPQHQHGTVDLIVTSPPYGSRTHGLIHRGTDTGGKVTKTAHRYGRDRRDRDQLAHRPLSTLLEGLTEVFAGCAAMLTPGGTMVIAARPWTEHGHLLDFPSLVTHTATTAGLEPVERCAALLAAWHTNTAELTAHHTFFRLHNTRTARNAGQPQHLTIHEDILTFRRPT
ncbi:MAG: TRM11 family SAM-dependent methyltransferase [Stackebrandtia sp.]